MQHVGDPHVEEITDGQLSLLKKQRKQIKKDDFKNETAGWPKTSFLAIHVNVVQGHSQK